MIKEDKAMAEIIYDCLVEEGANLYDVLSEEKFRGKIEKSTSILWESIREILISSNACI